MGVFNDANRDMIDDLTRVDDYMTPDEKAEYFELRSEYETQAPRDIDSKDYMARKRAVGVEMDAILTRGYKRMKQQTKETGQ